MPSFRFPDCEAQPEPPVGRGGPDDSPLSNVDGYLGRLPPGTVDSLQSLRSSGAVLEALPRGQGRTGLPLLLLVAAAVYVASE